MTLHIPIRMHVLGVILFITANLHLLKPPLRQNGIRSAQITPQRLMPKPQPRRQGMDPTHALLRSLLDIIHNLHLPIIMVIPNRFVPIARHFVVQLRNGRKDRVGVEVPRGGGVVQADDVPVFEEADGIVGVVRRLVPAGEDDKVVVGVFVVVAGYLLLGRPHGVGLDVRVEEAAAPAHVFEG